MARSTMSLSSTGLLIILVLVCYSAVAWPFVTTCMAGNAIPFLITVIETGHNNHLRIQDQGNGFVEHFNAWFGRT